MQVPDFTKSVGPGWDSILTGMHEELADACPWYSLLDVKEKFGKLTIHPDFTHVPPGKQLLLQEIIHNYTTIAGSVCEACGAPGHLRTNRFWVKTLCDTCSGEVS